MLSIITPILNGENYIRRNIESIKNLTIPFEHIIVDGGSTDGTLDVIKEYSHIKLVHQIDNKGMYAAINQGFECARGDYFCYVNSDDELVSNNFELLYEIISDESLDLIYSDANIYSEGGNKQNVFRCRRFPKYFLKRGFMPFVQPSSIFSRNMFYRVNMFNSKEFRIIGDLDFFQRIAMVPKSKIRRVNLVATNFYVYANSLGNSNSNLHPIECNKLEHRPKYSLLNKILFKIAQI